jgi:sulfatase modifying factor 1
LKNRRWMLLGLTALAAAASCHDFSEINLACPPPSTLCPVSQECIADVENDAQHCGSMCTVCPTASSADQTASCQQGTCSFKCVDPNQVLVEGHCYQRPTSCQGQTATCGPDADSCCEFSPLITTGTFDRSWDGSNQSSQFDNGTKVVINGWEEQNVAPATLTSFFLDRYEVTVGRFRQFLAHYDAFLQEHPVTGDGGTGAPNSGWNPAWTGNANFYAQSAASFMTALSNATDCPSVSGHVQAGDADSLPMSCVTYYEAFLFCVYDGGRLPTEAEWNYAAAGGSDQRPYPWLVWSSSSTLAIPDGYANVGGTAVMAVGSFVSGRGKWLQYDLAGNVAEFVYDTCGDPYATGTLCNGYDDILTSAGGSTDPLDTGDISRVQRGGSYRRTDGFARTAYRNAISQGVRYNDSGWRCARTPAQ